MNDHQKVITILGSAGGVARAVLSILNKSAQDDQDPIHSFIKKCQFHLIDHNQKEDQYYHFLFPSLKGQLVLHQFDLKNTEKFTEHLKITNTSIVIDVSWADTVDMLRCCNQLNVKYVNTALENTWIDENEELYEGFPLIERIRYFEKFKDTFKNTTAIIGSGMNPGVVQWMAIELLMKDPKQKPIGCYIVEHDNSFHKNKKQVKQDVIYTTWSPECFLDEAISSYPMFMQHYMPLFLYEHVYDLEFKVSLGNKKFYGCLMPHEEVYTLCKLFDMEGGFLYRVNEHTTELIRSNLHDVDELWNYEMEVLDPHTIPLEGEDLVGVLLVYKDKECYMYNVLGNESIYSQYNTNATYFQVACGIYASLSVLLLDQIPKGVYYVDELLLTTENQYGLYLTHYMNDFVIGETDRSEGLLLERMKRVDSSSTSND